MIRHDQRHLSRIDPVHNFIDHIGQKECDDQTINRCVHIFENDSAQHYDNEIQHKYDLSKRKMRIFHADRHRNKIHTSGGRIIHEDQRISKSGNNSGTDRRQHPVTEINWKQRCNIIRKQRSNDQWPHGTYKKLSSQCLITANRDRNIHQHRSPADRKSE